jgi:hypothetical protein
MMKAIFLLLACLPAVLLLQAQTANLRGRVTDESGAIVVGAKVMLNGSSGVIRSGTSGNDGSYSFPDLPPGDYFLQASAPDLALPEPARFHLNGGIPTLDLQLKVAATQQRLSIQENAGPTVTTDPANNASALVLQGADLQALSDDPTNLQSDLEALAGPSAGPNGGAIYIDGFSGGQLPSKESIREIRINQNFFSPEFDKLGFGRIEIFTKPGSAKYHGTAFNNFADDFWNSRNPYAAQKAPFLLREFGGNVGGPINGRASFFVDIRRDATDNGAIINGVTLDPGTFVANPFTEVYRVRQREIRVSPRIDYQLDPNNTLTVRYALLNMDIPGAGIGAFNLVSRGYDARTTTQTVQVAETAALGSSVINQIRFQFSRTNFVQIANSLDPEIQVIGSFTGGGAQIGHTSDVQNSFELQEYVTIARGRHTWRFGARLRGQTEDNISPQNFGGTFTFGGGLGPELDANNQPVLDASGQEVLIPISSIEQYRRTLLFDKLGYTSSQIRSLGGGVTQFTIVSGTPALPVSQFDLGAFVGDDWRARPNLTLSLGLRYETQTNIHDWRDFAPRLGLAWAPGKSAKRRTVLRAGFGIFYDRFPLMDTLTAERYNGSVQQQFVVSNPGFFPSIPAISSLSGLQSAQTIEKVSSDLRAPFIIQSAVGVERQLLNDTTVAVTYANSHGLRLLRSADINAPLPGTYDPNIPGSGMFPLGAPGTVFLMESAGLYNQNQLLVNINTRMNRNVSLFGGYVLNQAMSNTEGLTTFPANPYNFAGEYGPAATDVRNRITLGGSVNTRWNLRFSPFIIAQSGQPFDITVGQDLYGTTLFNGRPGLATDVNKPGVIETQYGLLDPNPTSGEEILGRNYGRGPGQVTVNLRVSKSIGFGKAREESSKSQAAPTAGGGGESRRGGAGPFSTGGGVRSIFASAPSSRPYNLSISMDLENIINHNNPGPIIGNITSPLFGRANEPAGARDLGGGGFSESANNRRLELQIRFTF